MHLYTQKKFFFINFGKLRFFLIKLNFKECVLYKFKRKKVLFCLRKKNFLKTTSSFKLRKRFLLLEMLMMHHTLIVLFNYSALNLKIFIKHTTNTDVSPCRYFRFVVIFSFLLYLINDSFDWVLNNFKNNHLLGTPHSFQFFCNNSKNKCASVECPSKFVSISITLQILFTLTL